MTKIKTKVKKKKKKCLCVRAIQCNWNFVQWGIADSLNYWGEMFWKKTYEINIFSKISQLRKKMFLIESTNLFLIAPCPDHCLVLAFLIHTENELFYLFIVLRFSHLLFSRHGKGCWLRRKPINQTNKNLFLQFKVKSTSRDFRLFVTESWPLYEIKWPEKGIKASHVNSQQLYPRQHCVSTTLINLCVYTHLLRHMT